MGSAVMGSAVIWWSAGSRSVSCTAPAMVSQPSQTSKTVSEIPGGGFCDQRFLQSELDIEMGCQCSREKGHQ